jgi:hypothetical protein
MLRTACRATTTEDALDGRLGAAAATNRGVRRAPVDATDLTARPFGVGSKNTKRANDRSHE